MSIVRAFCLAIESGFIVKERGLVDALLFISALTALTALDFQSQTFFPDASVKKSDPSSLTRTTKLSWKTNEKKVFRL